MKCTSQLLLATLIYLGAIFGFAPESVADINRNAKDKGEETLRAAKDVLDVQKNTVSRVEFFTSNYGIFGLNVERGVGGGFWPRGTQNQYIFGGGIWFAAQKRVNPNDTTFSKLCMVSYNPNSGRSWLVPGRITDGDPLQSSLLKKHRVYFSTDFTATGQPRLASDGPSWPIWDTKQADTLRRKRYMGHYVDDETERSKTKYPKGPAYISGEDIFAAYKDTDLSRYEGGVSLRRSQGYPLRTQYEQTIYSWGFGDYRDFIFIKYDLINFSKDTLSQCWLAPAFDMDIAMANNSQRGAANDRTRYVNERPELNLAVQWTQGNAGERGRGFGYIGFDFLESPAVYPYTESFQTIIKTPDGRDSVVTRVRTIGASKDSTGRIRKDKRVYDNQEQLGLRTFRNWTIDVDPIDNQPRYDFVARGDQDGDTEAGDKRFLMSTGPFTFLPGDTARTVVGIIFAKNSKAGVDADGSTEDLREMIRVDSFAQEVYNNNFQAPKPPDESYLRYAGLNNAIMIKWDSTSEISYDPLERGLDFFGYKLYRARRIDLDTFDLDIRDNAARGPYGWRQIAEWRMPNMYLPSVTYPRNDRTSVPFDSIRIVRRIDTLTYEVRRFINGVDFQNPHGVQPWSKFFRSLSDADRIRYQTGTLIINAAFQQLAPPLRQVVGTGTNPYAAIRPSQTVGGVSYNLWRNTFGNEHPLTPGPASGFTGADSLRYDTVTKALNHLLVEGYAQLSFPQPDLTSDESMNFAQAVILPYMDSITNHRTYIDLGDDNKDGNIEFDVNPRSSERIINNTEYYYRMLAFDEGDYKLPTGGKLNSGVGERNQISARALAAQAGINPKSTIRIISADSSKLGGLFNFRFKILDEDRLRQMFMNGNEGHVLKLEFKAAPFSNGFPIQSVEGSTTPTPTTIGVFQYDVILTDTTTKEELFRQTTGLESIPCVFSFLDMPVDNAALTTGFRNYPIVDSITGDTITFGTSTGYGFLRRIGTLNSEPLGTGSPSCYSNAMVGSARNTLSIAFDWNFYQTGGAVRPYSAAILQTAVNANTPLLAAAETLGDSSVNFVFRPVTYMNSVATGSSQTFNLFDGFKAVHNGPGEFEMEFTAGGEEEITIRYGTGANQTTKTVRVPYHNIVVRNATGVEVSYENGKAKTNFYPSTMNHKNVTGGQVFKTSLNLDEFNMSAFGWINPDESFGLTQRRSKTTGVVGQNKYYLPLVEFEPGLTLRFNNVFTAWGSSFAIDDTYRGYTTSADGRFPSINGSGAVTDPIDRRPFAVGDKVKFTMHGGALGLPLDGASVIAKVESNLPESGTESDEMLKEIKVVPNPYYVTTQAQKSPFDGNKIFFTKLPKRCTIKIYTIAGDLVNTIEHDEFTSSSPDRAAVNPWDLQTTNGQRVSSQTLIAIVETPNGSKVKLPFTVVVGSFRLTDQQ